MYTKEESERIEKYYKEKAPIERIEIFYKINLLFHTFIIYYTFGSLFSLCKSYSSPNKDNVHRILDSTGLSAIFAFPIIYFDRILKF